jgi:ribosome-binding factor A
LNMWKIPQINFEKDKTIDKVAKIDELFKKIHEEQKKN